jgi:hypothetical protein
MILMGLWGVLLGAWCDDNPRLTFQTADGKKQSLSVKSLKMKFVDGQLLANNVDGNHTFALSSLSKMYFTNGVISLTGDVNRDGFVNVADAVCIVNEILQSGAQDIDLIAADVNEDGVINISDITLLINMILQ